MLGKRKTSAYAGLKKNKKKTGFFENNIIKSFAPSLGDGHPKEPEKATGLIVWRAHQGSTNRKVGRQIFRLIFPNSMERITMFH